MDLWGAETDTGFSPTPSKVCHEVVYFYFFIIKMNFLFLFFLKLQSVFGLFYLQIKELNVAYTLFMSP